MPGYPKLRFGPEPPTPQPPPSPIEIWTGLGTLSFDYPRIPPSPHEFEIWTGLGTLSFDYPRIPPPPNLDRTLSFDWGSGSSYVETNFCIPVDTISLHT